MINAGRPTARPTGIAVARLSGKVRAVDYSWGNRVSNPWRLRYFNDSSIRAFDGGRKLKAMVRKKVYISDVLDRALKRASVQEAVSESEVIRRALEV
jgi:hypothetical protein